MFLCVQFGGSPVKVGEDEYHLFRDSEYVAPPPPRLLPLSMLVCFIGDSS